MPLIRCLALSFVFAFATSTYADILPGNLLPNPSVELDEDQDGIPDGWLLGGNDPSGDIWDTTRPVSGERNLLLFDTGDNNYTTWYTNLELPPDLDELQFQWTWAYEFTSDNPSDTFRMTVAWRAEGNDIGFNHVTVTEDEPEYVTEEVFFPVPDGADALRLEFVTGGPQTETGVMYVDDISIVIPGASIPGDFNQDGLLDAADINAYSASDITDPIYDLNNDSQINEADISVWIKDLYHSWIGDADLNGEFNSSDLVSVLAAGTYEADVDSVWTTGDFNGDGRTNSTDLVAALADGGYEQGPRAAVAAVPEPTGRWILAASLLLVAGRGRSHGQLTV
jgi:hypothetical protein